jgi:hypothetical protein
LLLHKYNSNCITKSSTSFHLGGLSLHIRCGGVPITRTKTGGTKNKKYMA